MQDFKFVNVILIESLPLYSFFMIILSFGLFNLCPAKWFCDYGCETTLPKVPHSRIAASLFTVAAQSFLSLSPLYCHFLSYDIPPYIYVFTVVLLCLSSISDIFYHIIADQYIACIFILAALDFIFLLLKDPGNLHSHISGFLLGGFTGFLCYYIPLLLGALIKKEAVVGFGDIKLMTALGFLLSSFSILKVYFFTCLFAGLYSFFHIFILFFNILLFSKNSIKSLQFNDFPAIPLVPFINFSFIFCAWF